MNCPDLSEKILIAMDKTEVTATAMRGSRRLRFMERFSSLRISKKSRGYIVPALISALREKGQFDGESRSFPDIALHFDLAAVPLDDSIGNGETQARALVIFRREKRIEYLFDVFFGDPHPGIGYFNTIEFSAFRIGFNSNGSAAGHGLAGVQQDVDKNLFNLVLIHRNQRQIRLILPDKMDVAKDGLLTDQREGGLHDAIQ